MHDKNNSAIAEPDVVADAANSKAAGKSPKSKPQDTMNELEREKRRRKEERNEKRRAYAKEKKDTIIYMGPNLPGGHAATGNVYIGMPTHLEEELAKMPELTSLFIPVDALPGFKQELETQGSEAYRLYQSIDRQILEDAKEMYKNKNKNGEVVVDV